MRTLVHKARITQCSLVQFFSFFFWGVGKLEIDLVSVNPCFIPVLFLIFLNKLSIYLIRDLLSIVVESM